VEEDKVMTTLYAKMHTQELIVSYTTSDDYPHIGDPGKRAGWKHLLRVADTEEKAIFVLLNHLRHYQYGGTQYPDVVDREVERREIEGYKICLMCIEGKFVACTVVKVD
jgi:hypothetical protein